ncbi:MAG: L-threonylcarbamoyladenylate synthase [Candidatus Aminicenantes bacterium]|nr:L-threonylcarbamoyladenylate synthase [Candidatus Aminicenantes bacterium]
MSEILGRDGVAVYPTDTYYGLGANAYSAAAVEKIYGLKGRLRDKPLSVVAAGLEMAGLIAADPPAALPGLAAAFWPGPLTLVLKARPVFPPVLLGPGGTVAVRVPALPWLRSLLEAAGFPLTATSANLAGAGEIADPVEARRIFEGRVDLFIDGGRTPGGAVSTIVDLTGKTPRLVRPGAVPWDDILAHLNK